MQRYKILHRTCYQFSGTVQLNSHTLLLRPREGHELRIESSNLTVTPAMATLHWYRDVEDNSVAIITFESSCKQLIIESEVIIQQFNETPLDFWVSNFAIDYPFAYSPEDAVLLQPYLGLTEPNNTDALDGWIAGILQASEKIQTYTLVQRLCSHIHQTMSYQMREEPGVQTVVQTLSLKSGSCRDFANLFMQACRRLGLASRFVSGYLHVPVSAQGYGSTHAWSEVYMPGAGWKGFDPTVGEIVGRQHIAVAVSHKPERVPPVSGSFVGPPGASLSVGVWVTEL